MCTIEDRLDKIAIIKLVIAQTFKSWSAILFVCICVCVCQALLCELVKARVLK